MGYDRDDRNVGMPEGEADTVRAPVPPCGTDGGEESRESREYACRKAQTEAIQREDWAAAEKWAREELALLRQRKSVPARPVAVLLRRLGQLASRRDAHTEAMMWYRTLLHMHWKAMEQKADLGNWAEDWGVYTVILERGGQKDPQLLLAWAQRLALVLPADDVRVLRAWEDAAYLCLRADDPRGAADALRHVLDAGAGVDYSLMRACHAMGVACSRAGQREEALEAFSRCLEEAKKAGRDNHVMAGDAMVRMAMLLESLERTDEAAEMIERVLEQPGFASMRTEERAIACNIAGRIRRHRGEHARAVSLYRQALREAEEDLAPMRADILVGMAASLEALGKPENAQEALEDAWKLEKDIHGENSPATAAALRRVHALFSRIGRPEDAEAWCRREIAVREALDARDAAYARALLDRAQYLERLGDEGAAEAYDAALAALGDEGAVDPLAALLLLRQKALLLLRNGEDVLQAVTVAEEALALADARLAENDPHRIGLLETAALALEAADRPEEALDRLQQASVMRKNALQGHHIVHARTYRKMAALAQKTGDLQRARMDLLRALAEMQNIRGYDREWVVVLRELGYLSIRGKALKQARSYFIQAAVLCERCELTGDTLYVDVLRGMGRVDYVLGNHPSSKGSLEKALGLVRGEENRAAVLLELAETLDAMGERDTALQYARQGLTLRQRIYPLHHMLVGAAWSTLGRILSNTPKTEDAIHAYHRAARCMAGMEEPPEFLLADVHYNLAMLYRKQEKWAAAAGEFRQTIEIHDRLSGMRERTAVAVMALVELLIIQGEWGEEPETLLARAEAFWKKDTDRWGHRMMEVYLLRGLMLRERGETDAARDTFREALDFAGSASDRYRDQAERIEGFLRDLEQRRPAVRRARILPFPGRPEKPEDDAT